MKKSAGKNRLIKMLFALTCLFVIAQIALILVNVSTTHVFDIAISTSLTNEILQSKIFILGFIRFIATHCIIYIGFVYIIWYISVGIEEILNFNPTTTYIFGIVLLLISYMFILTANYYFVPHSFFSNFLNSVISSSGSIHFVKNLFLFLAGALLTLFTISLMNSIYRLTLKKNQRRHGIALGLFSVLLLLNNNIVFSHDIKTARVQHKLPNIIIIGIDALRPDFMGFYNKNMKTTPHLDAFLREAMHFDEAYTPLPRTFPSWTGILTGSYPLHSGARGNNTDLTEINVNETLAKSFRKAGYETLYSTDDTRFNNTNELFGFDQVITPPMGLNDFLIGTINDFPLSNLLINLPMGKFLFPYNYANHGTAITYDPDNFLGLLEEKLQSKSQKPLFLAVHFTITHWPYVWFNDKISPKCDELCRAHRVISAADQQVAQFLDFLQKDKLLDNTIVVLLSDHGTSMGLRGDRITTVPAYQGNPEKVKLLPVAKYHDSPPDSLDFKHDYGIDSSYGYGGDVLSLKQYHSLLAIRGFGITLGQPHAISHPVLLLDIAPTLLDLVGLPALSHADGISLKPFFHGKTPSQMRPIFLESSFTLEEIERNGISVERVLAKTIQLYRMDPMSGLVFVKKSAEQAMNLNKQKAVMFDKWLLAKFPESTRNKLKTENQSMQYVSQTMPGFEVLVNLKTGQWTTEMTTPFAAAAPLGKLRSQLAGFYGKEINYQ